MKITPRKDEVKAVVELLESSDYDSAEDLAKDIIKRVADLFAERDFYAYAWKSNDDPKGPGVVIVWGPLTSEHEVKKFQERLAIGGSSMAVKLRSTAQKLRFLDETEKPRVTHCIACQHPIGMHEHERMSGRCAFVDCTCKRVVTSLAPDK